MSPCQVSEDDLLDSDVRSKATGRHHFDSRLANAEERARWSGGTLLDRIKDSGEVKPMSIEADFRSVSSSLTFQALRPTLDGIGNTWATALLQEGFLVKHKASGKHFLSMGCHDTAAWGVATELEDNGVFVVMDGRIDLDNAANHAAIIGRVEPMVIKELSGPVDDIADSCEAYEAVPATVRPTLIWQALSGHYGIALAISQTSSPTRSYFQLGPTQVHYVALLLWQLLMGQMKQ